MEDICLSDCFELTANKRPGILHDVICANGMNGKSVRDRGLKADRVYLLLFCGPRGVGNVPDVFDDSEEYGV
jgi:hypothetical protein